MIKFVLKIFQFVLISFAILLVLLPSSNILVSAQNTTNTNATPTGCSVALRKTITFTSLFNITNFLPIIPEACGSAEDGIVPLPFFYIFDVIVRSAGFLFSFAFYMLPVAIITYGARVLFIPFDPSLNTNEFREIRTIGRTVTGELAQFLTGIIIILLSYTIVFSILGTLQISNTEGGGITTDLSCFFTFEGNDGKGCPTK